MSTDEAPSRTISGLAPRRPPRGVHPDASRLLAQNRSVTTVPAVAPVTVSTTQPSTAVAKSTAQLNVSIPNDVRHRIRAAYRATSVVEGRRSFSDLVTAVLAAEAERLEERYNNGQPFSGGEQALPAGRPLGD